MQVFVSDASFACRNRDTANCVSSIHTHPRRRPGYVPTTARREREVLEHAVHAGAEQAAKADDLVDEAIGVGHGRSDPLVVHAKMLRLELLKVKADLERELEDFVLNCT
jgi:hypothetical protein